MLTPTLSVATAWNETGTVVTATHSGLAEETAYTGTVMANDAAGNPVTESWSFITGSYEAGHKVYLPVVLRQ